MADRTQEAESSRASTSAGPQPPPVRSLSRVPSVSERGTPRGSLRPRPSAVPGRPLPTIPEQVASLTERAPIPLPPNAIFEWQGKFISRLPNDSPALEDFVRIWPRLQQNVQGATRPRNWPRAGLLPFITFSPARIRYCSSFLGFKRNKDVAAVLVSCPSRKGWAEIVKITIERNGALTCTETRFECVVFHYSPGCWKDVTAEYEDPGS
ncbi:hypothetical protein QBC44DRAFT_403156 [Cladorrhinum sp. PSN332]|nr:hypothetical protein QBC44DRAFT_403156 [Cladorrhinum sp. PSN332]